MSTSNSCVLVQRLSFTHIDKVSHLYTCDSFAENSALMLANESQREAYERCLDEVANHVVQALLNQKDLREECIKLKMLVFDLERQNRALCELFQQKLPNHPTTHYQVAQITVPRNNFHGKCPGGTPPRLQCTAGNGFRTQHASPGPRGPAASMEALSPFFKKKAHILEVLRKMEETDPLKFHPSTTSLSFCDYSQMLMSTEAVLATADPHPVQCKSHHTHCHCSCSDADAHQHVNGDGAVKCEGASTCCLHCKRSPDSAPKPCNHVCSPSKASSSAQSHAPAAAMNKCHSKTRAGESKQCIVNKVHQQPVGTSAHSATETTQGLEVARVEQDSSESGVSEELTGFCGTSNLPRSVEESVRDPLQIPHCDEDTSIHNGLGHSSSTTLNDPSTIPERDLTDQEASSVRASASISPSPSCLNDVKAAAINSPSKLLKFLKIPSIGDKAQPPTTAVRLSPQLTRNSRIPCRTNNYEVYHSPVPSRRATTTERCKQPPPPPSRSESYPATHSVPNYENVLEMSTTSEEEPNQCHEKRSTIPSQAKANGGERKTRDKHEVNVREVSQPPPPPVRRSDSSSIPKRPSSGASRSQADSSHHAFKDRLAALGKLRSSEDLQIRPVDAVTDGGPGEERSKMGERSSEVHKEEQRHSKYSDSLDSKPKSSSVGLKYPGPSQMYEQTGKSQSGKQELCVPKPEGSKSKIGLPSPNTDAPQVLRNNIKCPGSLNLAYNVKSGPQSSNSPNKIPPKSPSKPCQGVSVHRGGKPSETPRYSSKSEERTKISGKGKKNPMYGDSLPPPPPRPPTSEAEKPLQPAPTPQSAIEQKVMKGIEENVLKLQEQDRGGQSSEVKQKASNGIASWFGLKKSKLPALSRKTDATKTKDEKKEWKINIPSVGRDSKMASRCKEGVEGLNISTLMEKAEGLRRALEEERAYVERSGRGHSCEVVMDQAQGQLAVMYRGGRSDNFMQQLLNRVDGKEVISLPQRRLSFDCKTSKPVFTQQTSVISHTTSHEDMEKVPLCEVFCFLFASAGSGASTYTLDSGIGTFPLPDCSSGAAGRGPSKGRAGAEHHSAGSPGRSGRRARTLDRELTSQEECYTSHKQLIPTIQYCSMLEGRSSAGVIPGGPSSSRVVDPGSLPVPAQSGLSRRGKTRVPSVPEMSREAGLELLRERPEEALSPSRPQVLETPESLSDSLYDSLSSCGSQG
uniref:Nck-associated protein 5 C-terminal domain-containing protein n=1 Tax=Xiphophorus couchianus TaxID=32473 RepID=A0A3B5M9W1_9TELE